MQLCSEALNLLKFDEIWIVPCGERMDKQLRTRPDIRLEMVEKSIEDYFPRGYPIKVNDIEIQNGESIPTYQMMKMLEDKYQTNDPITNQFLG